MIRRPPRSPPFPSTTLFRSGFAASLARPGGNVTGLSSLAPATGAKSLELLKAILPAASRAVVLGGPDVPGNAEQLRADRKSTRLNSSHANISYAVFCLKKKK